MTSSLVVKMSMESGVISKKLKIQSFTGEKTLNIVVWDVPKVTCADTEISKATMSGGMKQHIRNKYRNIQTTQLRKNSWLH